MINHRRYAEERKCKVCGKVFKPRYNAFSQPEKYCSNECFKMGKVKTTNRHLKRKYEEDPSFKFHFDFRTTIRRALKKENGEKWWCRHVGYDKEKLRNHMESQWTSTMNWNNYGEWTVDHVVPISFFECTSYSDPAFKACWSLENLQPLWLRDNISKSNKLRFSALKKVPLVLSMRTGILQVYYRYKGNLIKLNYGQNIDKRYLEIANRAFIANFS